ncbi:MAG TPA: FAD-binding oxidoreductase [Chloroflexia bacterium]|nr:FAD-binding oxidoreductase [Chloroflexia bacterium]
MRRWNGWGLDTINYPLTREALAFLEARLGTGARLKDTELEDVLRAVPSSRLPAHPLVDSSPVERLMHARGQSLPDWIALRAGRIGVFPDGVAYPASRADVRDLIRYAASVNAHLIPYGGGTSVVGHVNPGGSDTPVLTIDMSRMQRLRHLSRASRLATFEAGVAGPILEARLRADGYTLGHFPQSFELSTLGGWVATRSSGQQSRGYGRIEQLFAGGHLECPAGSMELPPFPASATGPDLRSIILGSEGRMGVLTDATVRITALPEREDFHAIFFPTWERALAATRQLSQGNLSLSLLRLSAPGETAITLALAGHAQAISALERFLSLRGIGADKCMLLLGFTGQESMVNAGRREALAIARKYKGVHTGRTLGKQWHKGRFRVPYLRNTLWEAGYAVDTVETAVDWDRVPALIVAVEQALRTGLAEIEERVHATTHLSHTYPSGSSIYTTYLYRLAPDPEETLRRWRVLKAAASRAIVSHGGTISHQHGVGTDHLPYLQKEKGTLGIETLHTLCKQFDPSGMMNPGKLVD